MKKSRIKQISKKQQKELVLRAHLKAELMEESQSNCMSCGRYPSEFPFRLELSHIIALSRGGETTKENCVAECPTCHEKYEKHPERRPLWQREKYHIS